MQGAATDEEALIPGRAPVDHRWGGALHNRVQLPQAGDDLMSFDLSLASVCGPADFLAPAGTWPLHGSTKSGSLTSNVRYQSNGCVASTAVLRLSTSAAVEAFRRDVDDALARRGEPVHARATRRPAEGAMQEDLTWFRQGCALEPF